jgi:putative hydrolase of the HAD superfamily
MPTMSPNLTGINAVLLDLWNTLSYSEYPTNPMRLIAEAIGIAGERRWRKIIERGMMTRRFLGFREGLENLERECGSGTLDAPVRQVLIHRWNEACAGTRLYGDALPALEALRERRLRLGILSNTQSFDLEFLRTRAVENLVDVVCLSCDLGRLKPDPFVFGEACRRLGLQPGQVLMVGDSAEDDVRGALEAGLSALHLDRAGTADPLPGAAGKIRLLTEIPSRLA